MAYDRAKSFFTSNAYVEILEGHYRMNRTYINHLDIGGQRGGKND
jgi:hypothetical protein